MKKVTFIIPSRNTIELTKLAYSSIRKNAGNEHEIILLDDFSDDGTKEWMEEINEQDSNTTLYIHAGPERMGITLLYDKAVSIAKNDIVFIGHSDMIYGPNFLDNMMKHLSKGKVICATRIEPPLHPPGPEKIINNFGLEYNQFEEEKFEKFVLELQESEAYKDLRSGGMFAPWMMYKKDYDAIGGHDHLFVPQSREDSDIFNRFLLAGYDLIQSKDAFVYHMTCRGSRYKDGIGKDSEEWKFTNYKAERNFSRKWGTRILHTPELAPIIGNKYDIHIALDITKDKLESQELYEAISIIEPWCTHLTIIANAEKHVEVDTYIHNEEQLSRYEIANRISIVKGSLEEVAKSNTHDVMFATNMGNFRKDSGVLIQSLPSVLDQVEDLQNFSINGSLLIVKKIKRDYFKENLIAHN